MEITENGSQGQDRAKTEQRLRNFKEEELEPIVSFGLFNRHKMSAEQ